MKSADEHLKAEVGLTEAYRQDTEVGESVACRTATRADQLMDAVNLINRSQDSGTVFLVAQGISRPWFMR